MTEEESERSDEREVPSGYHLESLREILYKRPEPHNVRFNGLKGLENEPYSLARCLENRSTNL